MNDCVVAGMGIHFCVTVCRLVLESNQPEVQWLRRFLGRYSVLSMQQDSKETKFRRKMRIYLHSFIRISGVAFNQEWATLDIALQPRRIFAKLRKLWGECDKKQIS